MVFGSSVRVQRHRQNGNLKAISTNQLEHSNLLTGVGARDACAFKNNDPTTRTQMHLIKNGYTANKKWVVFLMLYNFKNSAHFTYFQFPIYSIQRPLGEKRGHYRKLWRRLITPWSNIQAPRRAWISKRQYYIQTMLCDKMAKLILMLYVWPTFASLPQSPFFIWLFGFEVYASWTHFAFCVRMTLWN